MEDIKKSPANQIMVRFPPKQVYVVTVQGTTTVVDVPDLSTTLVMDVLAGQRENGSN